MHGNTEAHSKRDSCELKVDASREHSRVLRRGQGTMKTLSLPCDLSDYLLVSMQKKQKLLMYHIFLFRGRKYYLYIEILLLDKKCFSAL